MFYAPFKKAVLGVLDWRQIGFPVLHSNLCRSYLSAPESIDMERVARLIKNKKVSREMVTDEDVARAVWPAAVGKGIAAHTSRLKVVRNTLVVEVEDATWQKQLFVLSNQILRSLHKLTGPSAIEEIEFRVSVPRRVPQRAGHREAGSLPMVSIPYDDAESIQDPVLKKVYRLSRKRATA